MSIAIFFLIFFPLSLWFSILAAERKARAFVLKFVLLAWILFTPLLGVMNAWMPFSVGGDDQSYFELADTPSRSLAVAFDLSRFVGFMEHPGYPLLLSITNALTGHDLLVYKGLNFFFLISLSLVWYRIGMILEGGAFARRIMVVIFLLSPLWNYVFFLFKDMTITLLQSLFLLFAIQLQTKPSIRAYIFAILSTFILLLFRTPLVVQNAAVLLGGLISKFFGRTGSSGRLLPILFGVLVVTPILLVVTSSEILETVGLTNEEQVIGSMAFNESRIVHFEASGMNRSFFPLIYLFSETSGLNYQTWALLDSFWVRGVLAVPWIFFIVPFFLIGVRRLFDLPPGTPSASSFFVRLRSSRTISSPWSMVMLFVALSIAISWTVGDTSRWRIPDMPMVAAIAVAGWTLTRSNIRQKILLVWITITSIAFILFNVVSG